VGAASVEDDDVPFPERFVALKGKLEKQLLLSEGLTVTIRAMLSRIGVNG
jgi:type I restriction enzyme M protein